MSNSLARFFVAGSLLLLIAISHLSLVADEPPLKAKGKQGKKKKAEGSTDTSLYGVPADYVAFAKAMADPYSLSPSGPLVGARVNRPEVLIKRMKLSNEESIRAAVKHIDVRLANVEKLARELESREESFEKIVEQIEEKAKNGGYRWEVERELTTYHGYGTKTTRWREWVDDGPLLAWSASIGLEISKQQNRKGLGIAYSRAVNFGIEDAWDELAAKADSFYSNTQQLPEAVEVLVQPPDPVKQLPECIQVVNRSGRVLKNATLTVELRHFRRGLPKGRFFIENWPPDQGIFFLLPGYFPSREDLYYFSKLGPEFTWLSGCGGVVEATTRLSAVGITQPPRSQTFAKHLQEAADWDLKNVTRLLASLEDETRVKNSAKPSELPRAEKDLKAIDDWWKTSLERLQRVYRDDASLAAKIQMATANRNEFVSAQTRLFAEELERLTRPKSGFIGTWRRVRDWDHMERVTTKEIFDAVSAEQAKDWEKGGSVGMRVDGYNKTTGTVSVILFDPALPSTQVRYVGRLESRPLDPHGEHSLRLRPEGVPSMPLTAPTLFDNRRELILRPLAGRWLAYLQDLNRDEKTVGLGYLLDFRPADVSVLDKPFKKGQERIGEETRQVAALLELFPKGGELQGVWRIEKDAKLLEERGSQTLHAILRNAVQNGTYKITVLDADPATREITVRIEWSGVSATPPAEGKLAKMAQMKKAAGKQGNQSERPSRVGRIVKDEKSGNWQLQFMRRERLDGQSSTPNYTYPDAAVVNPARVAGQIVFEIGKDGPRGKLALPVVENAVWIALELQSSQDKQK